MCSRIASGGLEGTAQTRTLRRAAELVGGVTQLALLLHVEEADLKRWMTGEASTPMEVFLAALDVVSGASYERQANQWQDAADRARQSATRAQQRADRYRELADKARGEDAAESDDERLRNMTDDEQKPASNQGSQSKRKPEGSK